MSAMAAKQTPQGVMQQLRPAQPFAHNHQASRIHTVNLKHRRRQVDTNHCNRFHRVLLSTLTSKMPVKWSAVHDTNCGR